MFRIAQSTLIVCLLLSTLVTYAQVNYTANDLVTPYNGDFGYGSNMGYYPGWEDAQLADIAAGNESLNIKGAGVNSLRPLLPEYFLEQWGYDVRVSTFRHYSDLGSVDNVAFIGYPSEAHRADAFCPGKPSLAFKNMYEPIWDGGANGTPVNENNFYASYVYQMVSRYKDHVLYWEVTNEPDFDFSGNGWKDASYPDSWFNTIPSTCDYAFHAPIPYYVRMLRISYEVIKSLDPDSYVAVGGLGYPSFLDLVMRHTDNPNEGAVSSDYPLKGGAYFDVLSYHSYPHIDNSMRDWQNGGFVWNRHSDRAVDGVLALKGRFQDVLSNYGYDGGTYPEKEWIITESNVPRRSFSYHGSASLQNNFLVKMLVKCQMNGIRQFHVYTLGDHIQESQASDEYQLMGLYKSLTDNSPYNQIENEAAVAYKTTSMLLGKYRFDPDQTRALELPQAIDGAAFFNPQTNQYAYVLWAITQTDQSETANATYSFPSDINTSNLSILRWNHSQTNATESTNGQNISLTGAPIFIMDGNVTTSDDPEVDQGFAFTTFPNPAKSYINVELELDTAGPVTIELIDNLGRQVKTLAKDQMLPSGTSTLTFSTQTQSSGIYFLKLFVNNNEITEKITILEL